MVDRPRVVRERAFSPVPLLVLSPDPGTSGGNRKLAVLSVVPNSRGILYHHEAPCWQRPNALNDSNETQGLHFFRQP